MIGIILDVAIGLVLVYLLGSLICSAVNEWIARLLNTRANDLEICITTLLNDKALVKNLYNHPLIQCFTRRTILDKLLRRTSIPSHINPGTFSTALAETLIKSGGVTEIKTSKDVSNYKIRMLVGLEKGIDRLEDENAKNTLNSIVDVAKTKIDKIEDAITKILQELEQWFNNSMTQLSKWYRQKIRIIMFVIALLVSSFFNIDTIMIAKNIYQQKGLNEDHIKLAEGIINEDPTNLPLEQKIEKIKELRSTLSDYKLIGWNPDRTTADDPRGLPKGVLEIIYKIIGILITSLAVSMSASFWFDLLKRLLGFRKFIKPPTEEEGQ